MGLKVKATPDLKYHKGSSHICPKTFKERFYGLMRQTPNYLEGLSPVTSGIKLIASH